jgi:hypothetical protein
MDNSKFPIGHFKKPEILTEELLDLYTKDIETFPERLRKEVESLS